MIESENNPKTETQEDSAGEKKANAETKNKSMKGGGKNKTAPKGTDEPKPDKPVKKAAKKAAKKPDKPVKKAAKKAAKKADKPVKKAAKKAAKGDKPKAAAPKGQKVEGNPYRPGSAFFQIFERFRAKPKTKIALVDLFKGVDFPDQSRMLAHMKGHGETGERGVKFKLERVEGGFIIYTPR